MNALLLCAGLGTRLRPLTLTTPKCLLPIAGRPLLDYWLDALFKSGQIERVLINAHYKSEQFVEYVKKSPYKDRVVLVLEPVILGTAGTLIRNKRFFEDHLDLLFIHGDNFYTGDINELVTAHRRRPSKCEMTMMLFETPTPETCGIVSKDSSGIISSFYEKQQNSPGNLANAAIYMLSKDFVFSLDKKITDFSLEVIPKLVGRIYSVETLGEVIDIGTIESYERAQALASVSPQI